MGNSNQTPGKLEDAGAELEYVKDDMAQAQPVEAGAEIGKRVARYREDLGGGELWRADSDAGGERGDVTARGGKRSLPAGMKPFTPELALAANQAKAERRALREQMRAEALIAGITAGVASLTPNVGDDLTATHAIGDALGQIVMAHDDKRQVQAMTLALKYLAPREKVIAQAGAVSGVTVTVGGVAGERLASLLAARLAGDRGQGTVGGDSGQE
jgi:hypothetical protein